MTDLAPGLADIAHDSQRLFRDVLDAFAHPGRRIALRQAPAAVAPLSLAATAFVLTLVDRETPLWLAPALATTAVRNFARFHTGAPIVDAEADALFAVVTPDRAPLLEGFAIGTDAYPDRSATLVLELPSLTGGTPRRLRGPGIDGHATVAIAGLSSSFWDEWTANHTLFPCGVDLVFASGNELVALPRSIAVET